MRGTKNSLSWINYLHLFEGWAMLLTGPFLMIFGELTLQLYGVKHIASQASDTVPWFGALVTLMGWVEVRMWKNLPRAWIEACLLADILYLIAFYIFIERHGEWNFWSFVCSAMFPMLWAPVRTYWLLWTDELK